MSVKHSNATERRRAPREPLREGEIRRLERLFSGFQPGDRRGLALARRRARARAAALAEAAVGDPSPERLALLMAGGELLCCVSQELATQPERAARLVEDLERFLGVSRAALGIAALHSEELLAQAPPVAVRGQLSTLLALGRLRGASLWTRDTAERVDCVAFVGEVPPARAARDVAAVLLAGETPEAGARSMLCAVPVGDARNPLAALVCVTTPAARAAAQGLMAEAAPLLAAVLEREALLTNNAEVERSLTEASERKLSRLGFDLHDGPIQDVAALAQDLRLFREQLDRADGGSGARELVSGRFEDLEAQLLWVDSELRRLSNEVNAASVLLNRPFGRAVEDRIDVFTTRTGIQPRLRVSGSLVLVSTSQQIALLNILHESLNNIREHSGASKVEVELTVTTEGVQMTVTDDGGGFELESTLMRAAREGRLGLLGIHERVRLLGGQCRIDTRRGGPTVVSVKLGLWQPLLEQAGSAG
jgi:signal transduction histidine kinase